MRRNPPSRVALLALPIAVFAGLLAACNVTSITGEDTREPDVFDKVRSIDLLPRFPTQVQQDRPAQ